MPQDRRSSPNRSALGYWMPLMLTVTVATFGVAAWVWKERNDAHENDEDWHYGDSQYDDRKRRDKRRDDDRPAPDYASQPPVGHTGYAPGAEPNAPAPPGVAREGEDATVFARMSGALRRTPSPQQLLDGASKRVAAGVAAAGTMIGGALGSIREEDNRGYHFEDHNRWDEERETIRREQAGGSVSAPTVPTLGGARGGSYRKTVAIVISSDAEKFEQDMGLHTEHASILSHLPEHIDDDTRVFILIFAPALKSHPLGTPKPAPSVASSYSHIGQDDLNTPGEEPDKPLTAIDPQPISASNTGASTSLGPVGGASPALGPAGSSEMFKALYAQAQALATRDTMIMPFTTPEGWLQIVKHVHPDTVYVQASLSGVEGQDIKEVSRWVGQVVLVVGDDSGHGGLVDSEDEHGPNAGKRDTWWQNNPAVGLGKIEVVEGMRIGEDWRRRVKGHD